jgi:hypothetical protein
VSSGGGALNAPPPGAGFLPVSLWKPMRLCSPVNEVLPTRKRPKNRQITQKENDWWHIGTGSGGCVLWPYWRPLDVSDAHQHSEPRFSLISPRRRCVARHTKNFNFGVFGNWQQTRRSHAAPVRR